MRKDNGTSNGDGAGKRRSPLVRALPNAISLSRLPLALAYASNTGRITRMVVLLVATATDFFDGWLARRFHLGSKIGEMLDPVTDRVFVVTALVAHAVEGQLSGTQLVFVLARDLYTLAAYPVVSVLRFDIPFRARFSGKVVTTLQLTAILILVLAPQLITPVVIGLGLASLWAIVDYTVYGIRSLRRSPAGG